MSGKEKRTELPRKLSELPRPRAPRSFSPDDEGAQPILLIAETADTVTLRRADFDALLEDLEDAGDRVAVLEEHLAIARGDRAPSLTADEAERLLNRESPVKVWREKLGLTQRQLASRAGTSQGLLAEIEAGRKHGSIATLRSIAGALGVSLDFLVPAADARRP
jgi:mRNA interferase RelE/StbE